MSLDVIPVDHKQCLRDVVEAYETKEPLYVWGRTGIGKSHVIQKAAEYLADVEGRLLTTSTSEIGDDTFFYLDRRLVYLNPNDLLGTLSKADGVSKWLSPDWLYAISKQRERREGIEIRGIVSLEELNLAPELVQNAAYELILDRKIHDIELADGVVIVATGNTIEDNAFTFQMPDPLKTRFTHVELAIPVFKHPEKQEGWFYWAIEHGIDHRIVSFLSYREDLLFNYVEDARVFPTPRGWEKASKLMKGKSDEKAWRAVAKACGMLAGTQFKQFMETAMNIDIDELIGKPETFKELDVEQKFAAIASMTSRYSKAPEHYAEKLLKFAAKLYTGIQDDDVLQDYLRAIEDSLTVENSDEILRKYRKERDPEFATLLLSNMYTQNKKVLTNVAVTSDYGNVLLDMFPFLG